MEAKRVYWIDNVKAIGIFLVVFGHYIGTPAVKAYVYSFHMPLFFFAAGLVYSERHRFKELLWKRVRTLIIPYFVFSGIYAAFNILRRAYGQTPDLTRGIADDLWDILTWHENWFLGSLFAVTIAFYGFRRILRTPGRFLVFASVCTLAHFVLSTYCADYVHDNLRKCFIGIVFYGLGFLLKTRLTDFRIRELMNSKPYVPLLVLAGDLGLFFLCYHRYGLITINFTQNYFYLYGLSLGGIFLVCVLASSVEKNVYLDFLGANTILVYLLEGYSGGIVERLMWYGFHVGSSRPITTGYAALYSLMAVLILTPCILVINRYLPVLIGRTSGRELTQRNATYQANPEQARA